MKELVSFGAYMLLSLAIMASCAGIYVVYRGAKDKQLDADRLNVITALVNHNEKFGEYPLGEPLKEKSKVYSILQKRIKEGKIKDASITNDIVEVDLTALGKTVRVNSGEKFYMIKGNPYSAFSPKIAERKDFTLINTGKIITFDNVKIESKSLAIGKKMMTNILSSKIMNEDVTLVGGSGDFVLAKIINGKPTEISNPKLDKVTSVELITEDYIKCRMNDSTIEVISTKGILGQ